MSRRVVMPDTGNGNRPTCSDNSNKGREFERVLPGRPLARPAEGTPRLLRPSRLMSARTSSVSLAATVKTGMFFARKKLAELVAWSAGLPE